MRIVDSGVNAGTQRNKTPIGTRGRKERGGREGDREIEKLFVANIQCFRLGRIRSYTAKAFGTVFATW